MHVSAVCVHVAVPSSNMHVCSLPILADATELHANDLDSKSDWHCPSLCFAKRACISLPSCVGECNHEHAIRAGPDFMTQPLSDQPFVVDGVQRACSDPSYPRFGFRLARTCAELTCTAFTIHCCIPSRLQLANKCDLTSALLNQHREMLCTKSFFSLCSRLPW